MVCCCLSLLCENESSPLNAPSRFKGAIRGIQLVRLSVKANVAAYRGSGGVTGSDVATCSVCVVVVVHWPDVLMLNSQENKPIQQK